MRCNNTVVRDFRRNPLNPTACLRRRILSYTWPTDIIWRDVYILDVWQADIEWRQKKIKNKICMTGKIYWKLRRLRWACKRNAICVSDAMTYRKRFRVSVVRVCRTNLIYLMMCTYLKMTGLRIFTKTNVGAIWDSEHRVYIADLSIWFSRR